MKKLWTKIITIFLSLICLLTIVGCGKPNTDFPSANTDFSSAKKSLEAYGYSVHITYNRTEIADYGFELEKFTCAVEKGFYAEDKNQLNTLFMAEFKMEETAEEFYNYFETVIKNSIDTSESEIKFYEYYLENYSNSIDAIDLFILKDNYAKLKEELDWIKSYSYGRKDKVVWFGTEEAINHTKG